MRKIILAQLLFISQGVFAIELAKDSIHYNCHLSQNIAKFSGYEHSIIVPYKMNNLDQIGKISPEALSGVERQFYRWSPLQETFRVSNSSDELETFLASGFFNVVNQSEAANELKNIIEHECESAQSKFYFLGRFKIILKVNERTFIDFFDLKFSQDRLVIGTYSVPNSFESKIYHLDFKDNHIEFDFYIKEGSNDQIAHLKGKFTDKNSMVGTIQFSEDENDFGSFTGERI